MIAELFLILDLLGDNVYVRTTQDDTPIVSPTRPTKQHGVTDQTTNGFGGGLFEVGPITEIKQQIVIPPISADQATQWWLDATAGIPVTSLPPRAR